MLTLLYTLFLSVFIEFNFFYFYFFIIIISDWETENLLANYLQISQLHPFEADLVWKVIVEEFFP